MKEKGSILIIFLIGILLISIVVLTYIFLAHPYKVFGSPIAPFKQGEQVLSEKISYLIKNPTVGDRIIFTPQKNAGTYIGIIIQAEESSGSTKYHIASSTGKNPWIITKPEIDGKIYYPPVSQQVINQVLATIPTPTQTAPTPTTTQTISKSPSPTTTSPSTKTPTLTQQKLSPTPTNQTLKRITISGFTYEDRNDDGSFNSDDPKVPYMQVNAYDSSKPTDQISTVFSEVDGNFSISLSVWGDLILTPKTYNNFRPKGGTQQFSTSRSGIQFGFRSASAPVANQVGIIEGDIFQDSNRNGTRDSGEQGIYFYKLYLLDSSGNYYQNTESAQTTDAGGHFKYINLPADRTFTIRLSNPTGAYTIERAETNITLTSTNTQNTNVQIPVVQN